jgi:hypothetical protein
MTLSRAINEVAFRGALETAFTAVTLSMRVPAALAQSVSARCRGEAASSLREAIPSLPPSTATAADSLCETLAADAPRVLTLLIPRKGSIEAEFGQFVRRRDELRIVGVAPGFSNLFDRTNSHRLRVRLDFEAVAFKPRP